MMRLVLLCLADFAHTNGMKYESSVRAFYEAGNMGSSVCEPTNACVYTQVNSFICLCPYSTRQGFGLPISAPVEHTPVCAVMGLSARARIFASLRCGLINKPMVYQIEKAESRRRTLHWKPSASSAALL